MIHKVEFHAASANGSRFVLTAKHVDEVVNVTFPDSRKVRVFVVAWVTDGPSAAATSNLLKRLPEQSSIVLTGSECSQVAWRAMSAGDLRALSDQFGKRWIVIESDSQQAIVGLMQQMADGDSLIVVTPPGMDVLTVKRWIAVGERQRSEYHPWSE